MVSGRPTRLPPTCSTEASRRLLPIVNGSPTSPTSGRQRLALRGGGRRSVLPARGRLVDERRHDGAAGHRCPDHGDLATGKARCAAASLGSWQPVHQRAVPAADGRSWRHLQHEPLGQRLGQWSFFSSLKTERVGRKTYRTRDQARADVFDYIECFYNARRRHSTIGYKSPMEFERLAGLA